jgi:hypothetical protein
LVVTERLVLKPPMVSFICNICGSSNALEVMPWEESSCAGCGSNVRMRALIYLLSLELFGECVPLPKFPQSSEPIKGMGFSDQLAYAVPLAEKTAYVNTFYDREPFFDITAAHPDLYGTYKFILSADVFEHIPIPVERALEEAYNLLQPDGCMCITVPSSLDEETIERYPNLYQYSIVDLGGCRVLVNRTKAGEIEVHKDLVFHGGPGATLEMRLFSRKDLTRKLLSVGFSEVVFQDDAVEQFGILFQGKWGRPLVARKGKPSGEPLGIVDQVQESAAAQPVMQEATILQDEKDALRSQVQALETKLHAAANSRWLRLGRRLGLGPKLE